MIPGIILAAGRSSRFGQPKALLRAGGTTFVGAVLDAVVRGGAAPVCVVTRPGDAALADEVSRRVAAARVVHNMQADAGQLSSLLAGLDAVDAPGVDGVLVTLVDVPLLTSGAVRAVLDAFARTGAPVVRATHGGRHGHPVLFARETFEALRAADPAVGAKEVVRRFGTRAIDVEVNAPGVVEDVDTPADYARLFGREP